MLRLNLFSNVPSGRPISYQTLFGGHPGPFPREPVLEILQDSVTEPPKVRTFFPESWIFENIDEYVRKFCSICLALVLAHLSP
jgi:hypothetical protein